MKTTHDMSELGSLYLKSIHHQLKQWKKSAEKAIDQLNEEQLHWKSDESSLSIAAIMKHMGRNMQSRWTDFLTSDGEKEWRRTGRDDEFDASDLSKTELNDIWEKGWECFIGTIGNLSSDDLEKIVFIRNEGFPALEAINRGLSHSSNHVGQIVYVAKMLKGKGWQSLSIPMGKSKAFNEEKFAKEKAIKKLY